MVNELRETMDKVMAICMTCINRGIRAPWSLSPCAGCLVDKENVVQMTRYKGESMENKKGSRNYATKEKKMGYPADKVIVRVEKWGEAILMQVMYLPASLDGRTRLFEASNGWVIESFRTVGLAVSNKIISLYVGSRSPSHVDVTYSNKEACYEEIKQAFQEWQIDRKKKGDKVEIAKKALLEVFNSDGNHKWIADQALRQMDDECHECNLKDGEVWVI